MKIVLQPASIVTWIWVDGERLGFISNSEKVPHKLTKYSPEVMIEAPVMLQKFASDRTRAAIAAKILEVRPERKEALRFFEPPPVLHGRAGRLLKMAIKEKVRRIERGQWVR